VGEGAVRPEARRHPDPTAVDAAGRWGEGHVPYPGRAEALVGKESRDDREVDEGAQQSAEAENRNAARERAEHEESNRYDAFAA
jgi:hypothetical protein